MSSPNVPPMSAQTTGMDGVITKANGSPITKPAPLQPKTVTHISSAVRPPITTGWLFKRLGRKRKVPSSC
ncbi:hypothetical protein ALO40_200216 [Pseudomonas syringae pv. viburni]|uniref:DNA-binding protein n=1 Tax=Pseudomonas syringae pv. viburni TaxID=251703 RepID=A0A0Q0D1W0_9PSED|nr:hypothetical protein ALO40_200216 [Pseudomonas syringae pv. viburni]